MKNLIVTVTAVLLAGCASPSSSGTNRKLSTSEAAKSVVLLRLSSILDGRTADPLKGKSKLLFRLVNADDEKTSRRLKPQPVRTAEFANNGWVYFLLEPGNYQLQIRKTRLVGRPSKGTRYRLHVPSNRSVLYAGTFRGASQVAKEWTIAGHFIRAFGGELVSEPAMAETVSRAEFSDKGPFSVAMLHPADGLSAEKPIQQLRPISIETAGTSALRPPNWKARAADDYLNAAIAGGGDSSGVIAAYNLAAMPFAALAGAVDGQIAKKKWASCVRGLNEELANADLPGQLRQILREQMRNRHVPQSSDAASADLQPPFTRLEEGCRYLLRGEVRRVELVQGQKRDTICARVAIRFCLLDKQGDDYLYDQTLIANSSFRQIKEFAGNTGRALFARELTGNIHSVVAQFVQQVNPAQTSDEPELANTP